MYKWVLFWKTPSYISIQKSNSYKTNIISLSLGISERKVAGAIIGKGLVCTRIATDRLPLGSSLGTLLGIREVLLIGVTARAR